MNWEVIEYRVSWRHGNCFKRFFSEEEALSFAREKSKTEQVRIEKRLKLVGWEEGENTDGEQ